MVASGPSSFRGAEGLLLSHPGPLTYWFNSLLLTFNNRLLGIYLVLDPARNELCGFGIY